MGDIYQDLVWVGHDADLTALKNSTLIFLEQRTLK